MEEASLVAIIIAISGAVISISIAVIGHYSRFKEIKHIDENMMKKELAIEKRDAILFFISGIKNYLKNADSMLNEWKEAIKTNNSEGTERCKRKMERITNDMELPQNFYTKTLIFIALDTYYYSLIAYYIKNQINPYFTKQKKFITNFVPQQSNKYGEYLEEIIELIDMNNKTDSGINTISIAANILYLQQFLSDEDFTELKTEFGHREDIFRNSLKSS